MFYKYLHNILLILFVIYSSNIKCQEVYPVDYFRSPLDIPVYLSGTFGELRDDHFHTGVDIKTQGTQGKMVYAVADGYVSRINISPYGYGKAIYITHPNSYVSVYCHLKKFNAKIEAYVRNIQYERESYAFDKSLNPGEIEVEKGDLIAFTGNTGGSGGPHLHFEIREGNTQYPVNPFLLGFKVADDIPPEILSLKLYVMDAMSSINKKNEDKLLKVIKSGNNYKLLNDDTIKVSGNISFGIGACDKLNGVNNSNGVYSIELDVDTICIWSYKMKKLSFYQGRYVNALIDYPLYMKSHKRIQRSWISPNNHLMIYDRYKGNGVFNFNTDKIYKIRYIVTDYSGNKSELTFVANSEKAAGNNNNGLHQIRDKGYVFLYEKENSFKKDDIELNLPENALYEDIYFEYGARNKCKSCLSKIHQIHNIYTPLHKYAELSIKADTTIANELRDKALLVQIKEKGIINSIGGVWENGFVKSKTRDFGDYAIMLDTIPPSVKPIDIYPGKNISRQNTIKLRIADELSGIKSYRGTLNGKWILMEYNVNDGILVYTFDDRMLKGVNIFKFVVLDNKNNKKEYKAKLIR